MLAPFFSQGAHGVVVSHPLRMRKALGSIPSVSIFCMYMLLGKCHRHVCMKACEAVSSISGLVAEYIVAIDVTRVRFPADAFLIIDAMRRGLKNHCAFVGRDMQRYDRTM